VATDLLLYFFQSLIIDWVIQLRTALFWTIAQQVVVIPYRRFGTT